MDNAEEKRRIRTQIRLLKAQTTEHQRRQLSLMLQQRLENHTLFQSADTILLYSALPDEPDTQGLMLKWYGKKRILLPVVAGNDLVIKEFQGEAMMKVGAFGIKEPQGKDFEDYQSIDLAIIPGVAFDPACNRLGRGRGYYDRLLAHPNFKACKIGYCFPFQMVEHIPTEPHDCKMDAVISL